MNHVLSRLAQTLRTAREQAGLTQRELSARAGVPQGHISRIESGAIDLRVSSLIALSRVLELEMVLVPRPSLGAVEAVLSGESGGRPAYSLDDDG
jgi:transcriptional regulator with XRE-family HTH domain